MSFSRELRNLTVTGLRAIAADLVAHTSSPAADVAVTKATLAIEHSIRRHHRQSEAGLAAYAVAHTVIEVAEREGLDLPDADVTRVARAAAQVARGLVVGEGVADAVGVLIAPWRRLPGAVTVAA